MGFFKKTKKAEPESKTAETKDVVSEEKKADFWICPKCATRNVSSNRSCKDCGYYR